MHNLHEQLRPYARRVRVVSAWRGAAFGLMAGAVAGLAVAVLRAARMLDADGSHVALTVVTFAALGALVGLFRKVPMEALASSVDRRSNLNNRLRTAMEHESGELFSEDLVQDASGSLKRSKPAVAYPIRWLKWHTLGAIALGVACGVLWLSESEVLLSKDAKEVRKAQREAATEIRRVAANVAKEPARDPSSERIRKQLVSELQKMEHDLNRGNLDEAETLKRAQQLKKQADALASHALQEAGKSARTAEKALNEMAKAAAEEQGVQVNNPDLMSSNDLRAASENMVMDRLDELENLVANLESAAAKDEWTQPLSKLKIDRKALLENLRQAGQAIKDSKTLSTEQKQDLKARISDLRNAALDPSRSDEELRQKAENLSSELQSASAGDPQMEKQAEKMKSAGTPDRKALQNSLSELDKKLKSGAPLSEEDRKAIRAAMRNLEGAIKSGSDQQVQQAAQELKDALKNASPQSSEQVLKDAQQKAASGQAMSQEEINAAQKAAEQLKDKMSKESYAELQKALSEMQPGEQNSSKSKKLSEALKQASGEVNINLDKNRAKLNEMMQELDNLAELLNPAAKQATKENLEKIKAKLQRGEKLTAEEQKALEDAMNELKKAIEDFKNSEEIQKAIEEIKNSKEFKELMEMAKKLQEEADRQKQAQQNGEPAPPSKLTPEQIKAMQKQLEEIGKLLKDPKRREEVLNALREALQNAGSG